MKKYKRYLITSALPYANGPLHIGHLAGVYVPADIYTRYLRAKGEDVLFIGGSDEHGVPITLKAREQGVNPKDIVDRYHGMIKKSFEEFGISFDIYSRTTNQTHYETSSAFFKKLYDQGDFIEKESEQYYDEAAGQFLADRYIKGACPHCGFEGAYGDQCEKCGTSLSPMDLINPTSTISGNTPVKKKTTHWYLPLDRYEPFLKKWILEEHKEWKVNVYGQCKSWLDMGLQPRAVSRDLDWGVPLPLEGTKGKVLYVWFEAPIGYISATKELTNEWEKYWKDPETRLIHFIGKDNIVFHCIIFPALLKAEGSFILPDNVPAFEFLNLENDKISTSRNWAVWLHEYLEEFKDKQDVLRYVLTANAPETKDNDFTWKDFQTKNNNELVAILGNFVNRTMVLTHKYFQGSVPERKNTDQMDNDTLHEIANIRAQVENSLDNFRFREALKNAMDLARLGNKYLADKEPWNTQKNSPEQIATILNISLQITANLSLLMDPFLPFTCRKIKHLIDFSGKIWADIGQNDLLEAGHRINKAELLFEKIEDQSIEKQVMKLLASKQQLDSRNKHLVPVKGTITIDDFTRLDIRTATVLEAEKVPKADKLLKLLVDTGIDKRVIVAGIAQHYQPQEVIGKKIIILVNLAPRKLKGIESNGMVLTAENPDGKLVLLSPGEETENGSVVR